MGKLYNLWYIGNLPILVPQINPLLVTIRIALISPKVWESLEREESCRNDMGQLYIFHKALTSYYLYLVTETEATMNNDSKQTPLFFME